MTVTAVAPLVECEDCGKELVPGAKASCRRCVHAAIRSAEEDAFEEGEKEGAGSEPAGKQVREWAKRRHLMGQISREVREELELCAEDIEVGHG